MRTPSGILHVVDFKTDQIISVIQSKDYWKDNRHWEIKNNVDMLDFTVLRVQRSRRRLQQQNLVLKRDVVAELFHMLINNEIEKRF
ncbi:hypothetical protein ACT7DJ_27515 [Bacillus cereus]